MKLFNRVNIEKTLEDMVKGNEIGIEDKPVTRFLFVWLSEGRDKAEKLPDYKKEWSKNLEEGGFVDEKTNKIALSYDKEDELGIAFLILINGAQGFIKMVEAKK